MSSKMLHVALREFNSTVLTKGFILGIVMTPVIIVLVVAAVGLVAALQGPKVAGTVAVIDRTGLGVGEAVAQRFTEEAAKAEAEQTEKALAQTMDRTAARFGSDEKQRERMQGLMAGRIKPLTHLSVEVLPPDADVEEAKAKVAAADAKKAPGSAEGEEKPRIALAVIDSGVVYMSEEGTYSTFDLFLAPKMDFEIAGRIEQRIREAILDARIAADPRVRASGMDPADVRALTKAPEANARTVTRDGERKTSEIASLVIPVGFMVLLLVAVMTAGQYLLTTTIEEKGSRVMEVLLSAVSPMELMVGKILGQMGVGLLILVLYSGLGMASLVAFSLQHLVDPMNVVYLVIFFLIAFFLIASFMAAIGSAVTELREAQTLMTPVMAAMMVPWILWMPISRAPNSLFSTILSFVPGVNPFVMMIRLSGSERVPAWQIPASILVGVASAMLAAWAAAKIFRVGVLMYGKPPDFRTLVRWVRMA